MRLAVDATLGVTDVVEKLHHTIQLVHPPLGPSRAANTTGLPGFIYRSIRGTTRLLGKGLDTGLAPVAALLPDKASSSKRDAVISAMNGIYGDHLVATGNPLAIKMSLRHQGTELDLEQADAVPGTRARVMLFVHGLCLNEGHWTREGINHGEILAHDLGYTPLYLRYNTGLPIVANGRELALLLEKLIQHWPDESCELVIASHSMGGLVARSACYHARNEGYDWLQHLGKMVFIGTPHHGAPLERGGNWLDYTMDLSPYAAPFSGLARKRSAGISDLRYGSITGMKGEFVPLPQSVDCYAVAATLAKRPGLIHQKLIGDGLVSVDSAFGVSNYPERCLDIPESHQWLGFETGHIQMLGHPEVYTQLRNWFE